MKNVLLGLMSICIILLIIFGVFKYEKWGMFSPLPVSYRPVSVTTTTTPTQQISQKTAVTTSETAPNNTGLSSISQDLNSANIDNIGSGLSANSSDSSSF